MKRVILCLLAVLLLTGCNLRNRQDSRNFIPENVSKDTRAPAPVHKETEEPIFSTPVKEINSQEGTYTYGGETIEYSYHLPYLDLTGAYAAGCNAEIEAGFGEPIRAAVKAMNDRRLPALSKVDYEIWQFDQVLCLLVYRIDTATGERRESQYTVNAVTGSAVTADEILTAAGMSAETFRRNLRDAAAGFYAEAFGTFYEPDDFRYEEGLNRTLADGLLNTASPISLTKQGVVLAAVTIIDPAGAVSTARVPVPSN